MKTEITKEQNEKAKRIAEFSKNLSEKEQEAILHIMQGMVLAENQKQAG